MKYIKYIAITILLIVPITGFAAPSTTYLTNSVFVATTTLGCLEFSARGEIFSKGTTCGAGGGGSAGGTWSTTTSSVSGRLNNYSNNTTDIVNIGGTATTSSKFYVDPNINQVFTTGILNIGNSVAPQSTAFGTNGGKYQLHYSTSTNDIAGWDLYNINTGTQAGVGIFFQNANSPLGGLGALQTYYGGILFSGKNWNGVPLGFGALPANSTGILASDGAVVIGSATSTGRVDFYAGAGSFNGSTMDATILNTGFFGIGTTSPYSKLSVAGQVVAQNFVATSTTATSTIAGSLQVNGGTLFVDALNNKVGIGTTSPVGILHTKTGLNVANNLIVSSDHSVSTSKLASILINRWNYDPGGNAAEIAFWRGTSSSDGIITFGTNPSASVNQQPTERMRIDSFGNIGIGTTSPYAKLAVEGQVVASYYTATTTATSTFAGGIQTNLLNITSTTATSTFANGINITGGCFSVLGSCISGGTGGGGLANPTITTSLPFTDCEAQTDSYDFAPGGSYIQPLYGPTFTNATSSAILCSLVIPNNVSDTPNGIIMPYLTATTSGNSVFEVNATTTSLGQNWIPTSYTNLLASTSAASRFAITGGANYPLNSTTTISTSALNIVAGSILKVRFVNYHADANDTVENDLFMPKAVFKFDIKIN